MLFGACGSKEAPQAKSTHDAPSNMTDWQHEIVAIDQEIEMKTNQMNLFEAKAARAQNLADRLQFNSRDVTEARRYWQLADYYTANAKLLEKEIHDLKVKRQGILDDKNKGNPWP